ncbi:hypothetical protein evm_002325 [Chilo suppressalis]|nr:hypothetical protein evm_002325 [Chilo suppressalis]
MGRGQELLDAARNGDKKTVEKILNQITKRSGPFTSLRRGAGVNVQDDNGYTPLHHACLNGHKEIVRLLLSVDASPCVVDKKGATPLHLAAWKGDSNVVAMLLAHKNPPVNIDQLTSDHETALLIAAHFGYVDVVAQLMAKGADVTVRNIKDESALDLAAQFGRLETVQHLLCVMPQLVEGYKPHKCRGKVFSSTPLHRASKYGRKEVVSVLLAAGVDPNVRTFNGTPLHEAACFGKASVVRILLANGADLNAVDRRGKTVHHLLADYSEEATRRVRRVIREFENHTRTAYESEEDLPPFPVQDCSPTGYPKAPETQENTNTYNYSLSPSSSYQLTKTPSQSFVKKLASKCLGLKAKFNSAPNITNNLANESEVDVKAKHFEQKTTTNTLLIGNSKFFKRLSKKEHSGEVICNDEFDTISLDRISTLHRDSVVNRSNRSCPGFKTSLPNISENNELSDESTAESIVITEINCDTSFKNTNIFTEAINSNAAMNSFKPNNRVSIISNESANFVNECYESYEFSDSEKTTESNKPKPPPRPNILAHPSSDDNTIYENVIISKQNIRPIPAARTHLPPKVPIQVIENTVLYENVSLLLNRRQPEPPKRTFITSHTESDEGNISRSRTSTLSSDSMIDETNLEDILLSQKSKSFKHGKHIEMYRTTDKRDICRTVSSSTVSSDITEASAIENIDCSDENTNEKSIYLSMTGTLPNKKTIRPENKKVLFRHKTFTNIEVDRNSVKVTDLPKWNNEILKETLANYHIRGTGHCIYSGPTVLEFIDVFNRETLYKDVPPFSKIQNDKRDSYFETAICFCKPRHPKYHNSAEDLLEISHPQEEEKVSIDFDALSKVREMDSTSFRCFCDSTKCIFHTEKRDMGNVIVKFSAINKSISTPDITLYDSPSLTVNNSHLVRNASVPSNLEEPYAVINIEDIILKKKMEQNHNNNIVNSPDYVSMSPSTLSSTISSTTPYSVKDIAEVLSLNSTSTTAGLSSASDKVSQIKSSSSGHSGHWSLQSCESNVTIKSDASFVTCFEESSEEDSDCTLHSGDESSDADTVKSDVSVSKRPWVHSDSFRFGNKDVKYESKIEEEDDDDVNALIESSSKFESGISVDGSGSSSSECGEDRVGGDDSGVPRAEDDVSLDASLERGAGVAGVRSGSGRRRWDETEGTSEGDALSVSSAASSCAPLHMTHHHEYNKVSGRPVLQQWGHQETADDDAKLSPNPKKKQINFHFYDISRKIHLL